VSGKIEIGPLSFEPAEFASQGSAVLGIRDSGKTYTATLIAERMFDAGIPFTAFDPIGVWRYLRIPGKGKGYPVVVAGGEDADLPLSPASAPSIVEAAMQNGVSLVIDLFDMKLSKADWRRIVRDCVTLLLHRNKQYGLRHIFLEEAAEFAPQKIGSGEGEVYSAIEKLARMGGNSRLGYTLINQRSQEVNKAVLELCDNLFLHRQKGLNALSNLKKWLDVAGASGDEVMRSLPTLGQGECWAWIGGTDVPVHLRVPTKNSLHPDRRVTRDEAAQTEAKREAVNVDSFVARLKTMLANVEAETKANDPKALKAEIARLTRELAKTEKAKIAPPAPIVANAEQVAAARAEGEQAGIAIGLSQALEAIKALGGKAGSVTRTKVTRPAAAAPEPSKPGPVSASLTSPQQRILDALVWWEAFGIEQPTNDQVGFAARYSPGSGNFNNLRGQLNSAGLISYPQPGRVSLTEAGRALANPPAASPTQQAFHDAVRSKLKAPQIRLLDPLLSVWPEKMNTDELADHAGYSAGSGNFNNLRGSLKTANIIEYPAPGQVRASDWLFP